MNEHKDLSITYLETPRKKSQPMKLDRLLKRRMQSFLKVRHAKLATLQLDTRSDTNDN